MKEKASNVILFKKNEDTLFPTAVERAESGDLEGALSLYLELERTGKFPAVLYRNVADIYTDLMMYSESITYWFKYLNFVKKRYHIEAYNGLGGNYYLTGINDIAAYYFNLQINEENTDDVTELPFDDCLFDLYSLTCEDDKNKQFKEINSERDAQNIITAKKLFESNREKAYTIVKSINENSVEYENACITLAAFFIIDKRYDLAAEKYLQIPEYSPNYDYALNNLFGTYFCANDIANADKILLIIKKRDCAELEHLSKFFHIINSSGNNNLNYLYSQRLKDLFDLPNMAFYQGIAAYNVGEYKHASECFKRYYRASNSYLAKYYVEASLGKECGRIDYPEKLNFTFTLCEYKILQLEKQSTEFLLQSSKQLKKNENDIYDFASACFCTNRTELQIIACQILSCVPSEKSETYLKNLLINPSVSDNVKIMIITVLVEMGNDKLTGMVYDNVYFRVPFEKVQFTEDKGRVFLSSYAVAFGRMAPYDENQLYKLKISADDLYYTLLSNGNLRKVNNIVALAAYIVINADISIKLSNDELIEYIGSSVKEVNKIIELCNRE